MASRKIFKGNIGVFDSGFGGLDTLRGIVKELPQYNYIYLGDTARLPYGSRSKEEIYAFTKQALGFLFKNNCNLVILACNSASSDALRKVQQEFLPKYYPGKRVLGVLIPAAEEAVLKTKNKKIGVIATERTVTSRAFVREIRKLDKNSKVFQNACPLLVPLIEAGEHDSSSARLILGRYLKPLKQRGIDTLILGCTHYGIVKKEIKKIMGKGVSVISERDTVPGKLKKYLTRHRDIEAGLKKRGNIRFYTTGLTKRFERLGSEFFGKKIKAEQVSITH